jgi:hypothetical protein
MWGAIGALLLLPAIAMRFTDEVAWTAGDFAAATILLVGGGALFEVAVRTIGDRRRRALAGLAILGAVVLVWLQGAVGLI